MSIQVRPGRGRVRVGPSGRYFQAEDGAPFYVVGHAEAFGFFFQPMNPPELLDRFLAEMAARGQNTLVVQVENEVGFLPFAKEGGNGPDLEADERAMATAYARYVDAVAAAGKAEYPLPMYVNGAQRRYGVAPGGYPYQQQAGIPWGGGYNPGDPVYATPNGVVPPPAPSEEASARPKAKPKPPPPPKPKPKDDDEKPPSTSDQKPAKDSNGKANGDLLNDAL